jgi:hypothetical protein
VKNNKKATRINLGLIFKIVAVTVLFVGAAVVLESIKPLILLGMIAGAVYAVRQW